MACKRARARPAHIYHHQLQHSARPGCGNVILACRACIRIQLKPGLLKMRTRIQQYFMFTLNLLHICSKRERQGQKSWVHQRISDI